MRALAWRGREAEAATAFAMTQLAAVREACAEESGHPVDWDDPASYRADPEREGAASSKPWTVGGVLTGVGCLAATLAVLMVWVTGLVALFD